MTHSVFIDKIGRIFQGDLSESIENYDRYKDLSQMGVGRFSEKNVYLLDESNNIIKSFGTTRFDNGGAVKDNIDIVKYFLLGKKIDKMPDEFSVLENPIGSDNSSVLIYKTLDGHYPLIERKSKKEANFNKSNFLSNDYINELESRFKNICVTNAIKFEIK
jgi:hypothetical protein